MYIQSQRKNKKSTDNIEKMKLRLEIESPPTPYKPKARTIIHGVDIAEKNRKKFIWEYIEALDLKWHQKLRIKLYDKFYWIKYFRVGK